MAETAGEIVRDALSELTVQAQEQTVPAVDLNTGIRYLNRMMAAWDATEVSLGYTTVNSPDDVLTVPAGAIEGIVFNLALRLASGFDIAVSPALAQMAREGMKTIMIIGVNPGKANFPGNLPIGSGNEDASGIYPGEHFFPDCCEDQNSCSSQTNDGDSNGV